MARGLEGMRRQDGIHAAAVVITKDRSPTYLPIQRKPESGKDIEDAPVVTQYEMHGVEDLGLLKMDFLGLRNLDVISDALELIEQVHGSRSTSTTCRSTTSRPTSCCGGPSIGVFQLESAPMRALMRSMAPTEFEDVAALVALYRPGPMAANMHNDYADRKNGRQEPIPFHPDAAEILGGTYNLCIYQEELMQLAQKFAGYDLAQADNLRKAMGKKIREKIQAERQASSTVVRQGLRPGARRRALRHHGALRRLRLQQEPLLRLRLRQLPDRLPQGQLPGRVPGLPADQRQGQPRQGRHLPQRVPPDGDQRPRSRREPSELDFTSIPDPDGGELRRHPVRALGGAQRRRRPGAADARRAARTGRSRASPTSASGSTTRCSTSERWSR